MGQALETLDDDGLLGLVIAYRALTHDVLHKTYASHTHWNEAKNQPVAMWSDAKGWIENSFQLIISQDIPEGLKAHFQKAKEDLFKDSNFVPTYEILSATLGKVLEKDHGNVYPAKKIRRKQDQSIPVA